MFNKFCNNGYAALGKEKQWNDEWDANKQICTKDPSICCLTIRSKTLIESYFDWNKHVWHVQKSLHMSKYVHPYVWPHEPKQNTKNKNINEIEEKNRTYNTCGDSRNKFNRKFDMKSTNMFKTAMAKKLIIWGTWMDTNGDIAPGT